MALKSEKTEVFQLFGEGSLNDLSRALESYVNDGWEIKFANLMPTTPQAERFRGFYLLTRTGTLKAPTVEPVLVVEGVTNVVDAVSSGKVGKKVTG
jgi:hypothetical protein